MRKRLNIKVGCSCLLKAIVVTLTAAILVSASNAIANDNSER